MAGGACFLTGFLLLASLFSPWHTARGRTFSGLSLIEDLGSFSGFFLLSLAFVGLLFIFAGGVICWLGSVVDAWKLLLVGTAVFAACLIGLLILLAGGVTLVGENFEYVLPPILPEELSAGFWISLAGIVSGALGYVILQKSPQQ